MYIKLLIGDDTVAVFGVQRQEDLGETNAEYTYKAIQYKKIGKDSFKSSSNSNKIRIIKHRYSDRAEILAEKVLKEFNKIK